MRGGCRVQRAACIGSAQHRKVVRRCPKFSQVQDPVVARLEARQKLPASVEYDLCPAAGGAAGGAP